MSLLILAGVIKEWMSGELAMSWKCPHCKESLLANKVVRPGWNLMKVSLCVVAIAMGIAQSVFRFGYELGAILLFPIMVVMFYAGRFLIWKHGGYETLEGTLDAYRTTPKARPEGKLPPPNPTERQ